MAGLFNRLKIWSPLEIIKNSDLNGEFDNIINNLGPAGMSGWSATTAQMQIQTSPGTFGSESLATSLNGEIERLRYQINAIIGGPDNVWYDPPDLSISQMTSLLAINPPPNRIIAGAVNSTSEQPLHLVPNGTTLSVTLEASSLVPFVVEINGTEYSFSSNITLGSLAPAPSSGNTFTINDANCDLSAKTSNFGSYIADNSSVMNDGTFRLLNDYPINGNAVGASISSLAGTFQAFSYAHSGVTEYFTAFINEGASSTVIGLSKAMRGFFYNSSSAPIPAIPLNNGESVTLMQLVWLYITTSGTLQAVYTHPRYSAIQPATSSAGDFWYDLVNQTWKVSNGSTYTVANATLIGVAVNNTTACIAARGFDWYRAYSNVSNVHPEFLTTSEYRTKYDTNSINVYGSVLSFDKDTIRWTATSLESGTTLASSTTYYLYLSQTGQPYVSKYFPLRRYDLGGYYHPYNSWRCCGLFLNNSSGNFDNIAYSNISNLNAEFLHDKSIGIEKRKSSPYILYDPGASTPQVASINQISVSKNANISGVAPGANTPFFITDGGNNLTCELWTSGRPVLLGFIQDYAGGTSVQAIQNNQSPANIGNATLFIQYFMDGTQITNMNISSGTGSSLAHSVYGSSGSFWHLQLAVLPGLHTFTVKAMYTTTDDGVTIQNIRMFAMEV